MSQKRANSDSRAMPADERELVQRGYRYALSLTHANHDAEDLVQSACTKLFERRGVLGPPGYLFTTIRNLFYDGTRRSKILEFRSLDSAATADATLITAAANSEARWPGARHDVEFLVRQLRPEEREAVYLNAVEGYSAREIGELTGRPRNTVLSLLHRARAKMKAAAATDASDDANREVSDGRKGEA